MTFRIFFVFGLLSDFETDVINFTSKKMICKLKHSFKTLSLAEMLQISLQGETPGSYGALTVY